MNVLITGIDGFVGSHLAGHVLAQEGVTVYGLIRAHPPIVPVDPAVRILEADITDRASIRRAVGEASPDRIYHLAGQAFVPTSVQNPLLTFHVNVNGVLNLLECIREDSGLRGRTRALIIGSGEVYGNVTPAMLPVAESAPLEPANPYAVSKACADMITRQYRSSFGLDVTMARPFNHLGPGQSELFVGSAFARQVAEIKLGRRDPKLMVGNLEPKRDFTDVRDVVRAYTAILDIPNRKPAYNICTGRSLSIRALLDQLLQIAGLSADVILDPSRVRREEVPDILGDASLLRSETGWTPRIPIAETLRDLLAYWEARLASV